MLLPSLYGGEEANAATDQIACDGELALEMAVDNIYSYESLPELGDISSDYSGKLGDISLDFSGSVSTGLRAGSPGAPQGATMRSPGTRPLLAVRVKTPPRLEEAFDEAIRRTRLIWTTGYMRGSQVLRLPLLRRRLRLRCRRSYRLALSH